MGSTFFQFFSLYPTRGSVDSEQAAEWYLVADWN